MGLGHCMPLHVPGKAPVAGPGTLGSQGLEDLTLNYGMLS